MSTDWRRQLQLLDNRYATLARSKYSFGAGTATSDPTPEQLTEIEAQMAMVKEEMATMKAEMASKNLS
jgi:hypothetical protein